MAKVKEVKINELLSRGVEEVIVREHLEKRLLEGDSLRIKFGIDPTGSKLHIGHMVVMRKLREFQELGHTIIFLIGDLTAKIGDPTGRLISRSTLSEKEIHANMKEYQKQASKIIDIKQTEIRYNSEWFGKMTLQDLLLLSMQVTYQQVSAREDFKKRLARDEDFTVQEFMYPVLQGYDSVALKADIEMGGRDQKFNMLMGRMIQRKYEQESQDIITCPLLLGTDGRKMSKSYDNYIGVEDPPEEMFGKVMSIRDELMPNYFELATRLSLFEIEAVLKTPPRQAKARLAREIVSLYHGQDRARQAEKEFEKVFKDKQLPERIPKFDLGGRRLDLVDILVESKMVSSKSQARHLISEGGVKKEGNIIRIGKRRFLRLV